MPFLLNDSRNLMKSNNTEEYFFSQSTPNTISCLPPQVGFEFVALHKQSKFRIMHLTQHDISIGHRDRQQCGFTCGSIQLLNRVLINKTMCDPAVY
jgi:hypothetical protein